VDVGERVVEEVGVVGGPAVATETPAVAMTAVATAAVRVRKRLMGGPPVRS
jgi:hypothetical protein